MRILLVALLLLAFCAEATAQFTTFSFNGTGTGAIPDGTATTPPAYGTARTVSFAVSGVPLNVRNVVLSMDVAHTWVGDLDVVLRAPGGSPAATIFSRTGATTVTALGDDSDLSGAYAFSDLSSANDFWASAAAVGATAAIPAGQYRTSSAGGAATGGAVTSLDAVFAGLTPAQANGTWTLEFRDSTLGDTGTVNGVVLILVVGPTVTSITPSSGDVAGGTLVVISGTNFDPASTTVTFGGLAAAGTVSQTQIQCSSPPHAAGPVDVVVTTQYGSFTALSGFTYTTPGGGGGGDGGGGDGGCSTSESPYATWLQLLTCGVLLLLFARSARRLVKGG